MIKARPKHEQHNSYLEAFHVFSPHHTLSLPPFTLHTPFALTKAGVSRHRTQAKDPPKITLFFIPSPKMHARMLCAMWAMQWGRLSSERFYIRINEWRSVRRGVNSSPRGRVLIESSKLNRTRRRTIGIHRDLEFFLTPPHWPHAHGEEDEEYQSERCFLDFFHVRLSPSPLPLSRR